MKLYLKWFKATSILGNTALETISMDPKLQHLLSMKIHYKLTSRNYQSSCNC